MISLLQKYLGRTILSQADPAPEQEGTGTKIRTALLRKKTFRIAETITYHTSHINNWNTLTTEIAFG